MWQSWLPDVDLVVRATRPLLVFVAAISMLRSGQVLLTDLRHRAGVMHYATEFTVVKKLHVRCLSLAVLLLLLALISLWLRSDRRA